MKILIVAATRMEVNMLVDEFAFVKEKNDLLTQYEFAGIDVDLLIAGIGTTFTTFRLTRVLVENSYDLVVNTGISGSLNPALKIGEIVNVISEEFADLGIEKANEFLTLFESGFIDANDYPFENGVLKASNSINLSRFKSARGITANKSHGRKSSISKIRQKFSADVESMEGAAVFYVCNSLGVLCIQIRAISNYVEPRDPSKWNIPLALENLKDAMLTVLDQLTIPIR